ncbi:MAG: hypothetical protein GF353_21175 [Candidatus Lokiarchaeota archaeon]|nr:hypothetical protein [Candidatus Lokiarchaeota archaeon]
MISANEWWKIIGNYNIAIFPAQIILHLVAVIITVYFVLRSKKEANIVLKAFFAFNFAWIGIIFFIIFGTGLSMNYLSAFLFILVACFFGADIFRKRIEFQLPGKNYEKMVMTVLLVVISCYPFIGFLFGHQFPRMIFLGVFPCSTTALALTFLAFSVPKIDLKPYILLLIWAIPFPIFIQIPQFGVYEDAIMLSTGIVALITLILNREKLSRKNLF